MLQFDQLVSINFQGTVVTFGRVLGSQGTDIYFNVLGADTNVDDPRLSWAGFAKVDFPQEVRQAGMSLITVQSDSRTMQPAHAPFRVVTDQKYIIIVQQSARGTLYINRFRLLKVQSGSDQKRTTYEINPAWEVRYSRSGKEDVPADSSDSQGYLDANGQPFLEPALELAMIDGVASDNYECVLLPVSGKSQMAWQFLTLASDGSSMHMFNFPPGDTGLPNLTDKTLTDKLEIAPDSSFQLRTKGTDTALLVQSPPRAVTYTKHENVVQPDGTSVGVKRAVRVMLTVPVKDSDVVKTATLDSAVGPAGTIATISGALIVEDIVPAEFDLLFVTSCYLSLSAPGGVPNPLAITGAYKMRFMAAIKALADGVQIIGGDLKTDAKTAAPYVRVVDGGKLEVGFGTGSAAVTCTTLHQVLYPGNWADIEVQYMGKGDNPFVIRANGNAMPVTQCTVQAEPGGTPLSQIGAAQSGYEGALNRIAVDSAGANILTLPCNTVDYGKTPPETPNTAGNSVLATVYGAKPEPSSAPVGTQTNGAFYVSADGLSYYAGLADFIVPQSPTCLVDGADGLLHLYYSGKDADLSVAQFSKNSARATFVVGWTTDWDGAGSGGALMAIAPEALHTFLRRPVEAWAYSSASVLTADDGAQTGMVSFVAHRVGTSLNGTKVTVRPSSVSSQLCDVTVIGAGGLGTETWTGLPRDIDAFVKAWNGAAASNPDDQSVLNQTAPLFDYAGKIAQVLAPSTENDAYFLFTSVPYLAIGLGSATVEQAEQPDEVKLTFTSTSPSNWEAGKVLTHVWTKVPRSSRGLTDVLTGRSTSYDYSNMEAKGSRAYGLEVSATRSDEAQAHVLFFVLDALRDFTLVVSSGNDSTHCIVKIAGVTLTDVPRDQIAFAEIINGKSTSYPYPGNYKDTIARSVFALTNGLSAAVQNANAVKAANALAYAGLLRAVSQGQSYDAISIGEMAKTDAVAFQKSTLKTNGDPVVIRGSRLFGTIVNDSPTNGEVGRLLDTGSYVDGQAPISVLGVNGGWIRVSPKFSLETNLKGTGYVSFDVDKAYAPAESLALSSDLTVEGWIRPDAATKRDLARALTYNVTGNLKEPDLPLQYMVGSKQGPALLSNQSMFFQSAFNFHPPELTVQVYIKTAPDAASGRVFTVFAVTGGAEYVSLSINQMGNAVVDFRKGAAAVTSANAMQTDVWTCLTVTVAKTSGGKLAIRLFWNNGDPVTAEANDTFTEKLGTLQVGSDMNEAITASLNGVAFWQRALTIKEVKGAVLYGFPDNDPLLGIRWNLAEGDGTTVMNSAATGPAYNTNILNSSKPGWDPKGAFDVPYAGRNELILVSNRIIKDWTHVALCSRQGRGLKLANANHGTVSDAGSFNPASDLALEAWIEPTSTNAKQVILEKPGSYSFYLNSLGQVCLSLKLQQESGVYDEPPTNFEHVIAAGIEAGKTSHVVVNFTTGTVQDKQGSKEYVAQKYYVKTSIFVNGVKANIKNPDLDDLSKPVSVRNESSAFYLGISGNQTFAFTGFVSHARVWSRTLNSDEITRVYKFHGYPRNTDGLVAGWDFAEETGTTAEDRTSNNDLTLTSSQLWTVWQDVAQAEIVVDGGASLPQRVNPSDVGGYGATQFTFSGSDESNGIGLLFKGQIDDIRLFNKRLTVQQIAESRNTPLGGTEDGLVGYWPVEAGSGRVIHDATGRGNNGIVKPDASSPGWTRNAAPIQNEAAIVVNVLDGIVNFEVAQISVTPSVIEYATTQRDAYGKFYSVMMRGYFYVTDVGNTTLQTGYKVGDLDTIFVGQVQSKPSIIGYIEGGPPLPSENQTIAYWSGDMGGPARLYAATSSVSYVEAETKTWSFSAAQSSTFNGAFNIKGGFYQVSKSEVSVGLGAEAETRILETKVKLGLKTTLSGNIGSTDMISQSHSNTNTLTSSLTPPGSWEPADNILNATVGRRYIQNNIGMAIVKSAVADLYMQALKGTQTPVGYALMPNNTIPIDTNIIDFPINPKYVKNGTLDGKVGLVNDPDYPNANDERGSYFKPVEAYALKQKIEKQEQDLKAYYDQFSTNKYRLVGSLGRVKDKLKENPTFDFAGNTNRRSLVNTYVWTAAGGLRKEEQSVANTYSETYTGASDLKFAMGFEVIADIGTPFGGYYVETDAMLGNTWTMTATKSESSSNGFSLSCNVDPTNFLPAPRINSSHEFIGYENTPAAGKVDGYRYMSFLLAPSEANFSALNGVIDPNWLANSTTASANAMREALTDQTQPWRILFRTTYVSRVPAQFQPVRDDTSAPTIKPPANLESNVWLLRIMDKLLHSKSPTPVEVAVAIDTLLGKAATPGLLKDLIPWWSDFYATAQTYGSEEFIELAGLRIDLLAYVLSKYEAEAYAPA